MLSDMSEAEPDYRATLAAERTYLAYLRTGLALVAAGVALAGALPHAGATTARRILGMVIICLGGLVIGNARRRWRAVRSAMRRREPLPAPRFAEALSWALVAIAVAAAAIALAL
jgi:putative membrane protein